MLPPSVARSAQDDTDIHIAGLIVHASRTELAAVRSHIALLPRAIVHAADADGRMVVTLETDSSQRALDCMDALRALPGVLNVALVYQHAEPAAAMDEEVE
ncbi:chaperone NapD [Pseudoduganella violacea]|uniref:Chaperone NapD n=1 Tax=Pseudoduganella violacea TaxID=1715466 RepID=A0A7W5FVF4_9BURK|nr:chaperone NapD [Pseudoduganella violacea]MBB3120950.1 nitrate reductase NapD [Pseudoduganella violacea]